MARLKKIKKFVITFAGVSGSSKSPIAHFLSIKFNLPIFSNDAVRREVMEDGYARKGMPIREYEKRRDNRLQDVIVSGISFIFDASMDRKWRRFKPKLVKAGYAWFIISLDLSRHFLDKLYAIKQYTQSLDSTFLDHQKFLADFDSEIGLHITDREFPYRLKKSFRAAKRWLSKQ